MFGFPQRRSRNRSHTLYGIGLARSEMLSWRKLNCWKVKHCSSEALNCYDYNQWEVLPRSG